jgi:outer membrane immunogenic protein
MKKFWLGTLGIIASGAVAIGMANPAAAADLPARPWDKAPAPMVSPMYDWTGFYVGANGGGGWARKCWDLTVPVLAPGTDGCRSSSGGVAGGQVGYRWQTGTIVFGLEGQGDWAGLSGSGIGLTTGFTDRSRLNSFGLFTGQLGLAWDNALFYLKGGAAVTNSRYDIFTPAGVTLASASATRWGGTAGLGVEYGFTPNWTFAVEYDHIFVDPALTTFTTPAGGLFATDRIRGDTDLLTARVNFRWGGPVVARY